MPPLKVNSRPDGIPVRCKARRYGPKQRAFMARHMDELERAGLVFKNSRSRWRSPPLIVKKPEGNDFRMTVDVRAVNTQTERMVWPMPMLKEALDHVGGASVFFSLYFFKDYWQFQLHEDSQEMFSFLTDQGVYTPSRLGGKQFGGTLPSDRSSDVRAGIVQGITHLAGRREEPDGIVGYVGACIGCVQRQRTIAKPEEKNASSTWLKLSGVCGLSPKRAFAKILRGSKL
jgi:hypothetical protein